LNGMFAFALWDARRQRLLLGRDRLGIKPLYLWNDGRRLIFASEAKAILALPGMNAELDPAALSAYLMLGYVPAPQSIFRGIRKLAPATVLSAERGKVDQRRYWQVAAEVDRAPTEGEWVGYVGSSYPTALDLAMGQGRNALYLASQGWKVTGIDISDEGIRVAREEAGRRKLSVETINADIDTYDFGIGRWDLVTMIYATDNTKWIEKAKLALRQGGLFVLEYYAAPPGESDSGFEPGQLAKLFADGFEILRDEIVEDEPDWAMDRASLVHFVARKR